MHKSIDNASQFRDEFAAMNRQTQFSYEGLGLLFDYLEDGNPDYQIDVIGLCCEFIEDTPSALAHSYDIDLSSLGNSPTADSIQEIVLAHLENYTSIVGVTETTIIFGEF